MLETAGTNAYWMLEGHVERLHTGGDVELLDVDMRAAADAGGGVVELSGLRFEHRDQLLHRIDAKRRRYDQHARQAAQHGDGRQILQAVVTQVLVKHVVHRVSRGHEHERIAIGLGARGLADADGAAGAGAVVHDHRLAPRGVEALAHDAPHHVGCAAGRKGDDDLDRLRGIALRACSTDPQQRGEKEEPFHPRFCLAQYCGSDLERLSASSLS
jgi:hypothetical protein